MMPDAPAPPAAGLCLDCNYPLRELRSGRCPECGRAFDPADPATFNAGRPLGTIGRWLLKPPAWPTVATCVLALALVLYATGIPSHWPPLSTFEYTVYRHYANTLHNWREFRLLFAPIDRVFLIGVALGALGATAWLVGCTARGAVVLVRRPGKALRRRATWRHLTILFCLSATATLIASGWPLRLARHYVDRRQLPGARVISPTPSRTDHFAIARAALIDLPLQRHRRAGLKMLIESHPEALPILISAALREKDPDLRAAELRLISLYRDPATIALLEAQLNDPDARVRAAAIDALGLVHAPAYPVGDDESPVLPVADTPINIHGILGRADPTTWSHGRGPTLQDKPLELPDARRALFIRLMTEGQTPDERQAAARALLPWPPKKYTLRYAEWGVWLSTGGEIKVLRKVLDEMPPFVHRTGNPAAAFDQRIRPVIYISNKPVIHLTADQPLAVDLEVLLRRGRPFYAYPRPDDFGLLTEDRPMLHRGADKWPDLQKLDSAAVPPMKDLSEGYPWLTPSHRRYGQGGVESGGLVLEDVKSPVVTGLGMRWQSLIVSPQRLAWMTPPQVTEAKHRWWTDLRDRVPSSWVSSRGESERFLYYDGPTLMKPPVTVSQTGHGRLRFEITPPQIDATADILGPRPFARYASSRRPQSQRAGLAVRVRGGKATAFRHAVPGKPHEAPFASGESVEGDAATAALLKMLTDAGLTEAEAQGLLDCWRETFFRADGDRFILLMSQEDYHDLCPMVIRPKPTTVERVGLLLTELWTGP